MLYCYVLSADEEYVRKQLRQIEVENGESLKSLRWDSAVLRKVIYWYLTSGISVGLIGILNPATPYLKQILFILAILWV